ncbi:MAG: hypothetical protein ABIR94_10265 [Rubrivivax sp.]
MNGASRWLDDQTAGASDTAVKATARWETARAILLRGKVRFIMQIS